MKKSSVPVARTIAPARFDGIPPLQWWRGERRGALDAAEVVQLRAMLAKLYLLAFPNWPAAVGGDAAAAVRVAICITCDLQSPTWLIDCAGSVLLLCVAEGSDTAALVLRHFRRRYAMLRGRYPMRRP